MSIEVSALRPQRMMLTSATDDATIAPSMRLFSDSECTSVKSANVVVGSIANLAS